jgi:hypothetical protein
MFIESAEHDLSACTPSENSPNLAIAQMRTIMWPGTLRSE